MLGEFERTLGHNLSDVRLIFDADASRYCASLGCAAFTAGSTIFFAERPTTESAPEFRRLLAHELVHVLQNRRGAARVWLSQPGDDAEMEAAELAPYIAAGRSVSVTCGPSALLQPAAAAPAWPQAIKNLDELKSWMGSAAYTEAQTVLRDLPPTDRASFGKAINELYTANANLAKRACKLLRSTADADKVMLALVVRELKQLPAADLDSFLGALESITNLKPWLTDMVKAANELPISDANKALLWLAVARRGWPANKALKEYKKVRTVKQGSPVLDAAGFIGYWDLLSRKHAALTDGNPWATNVQIPLAAGNASVSIPGHKVIHFVEGHTFEHFRNTKANFVRSKTTHMMSFWPPAKGINVIVNDARTALLNNQSVKDLLARSTAQWPVNREGEGIDVDNPYALHLGFYRTGETSFNLTQFYPNFDAAGGNTSIILHEEMVIAIFSVLLDLG